MSEMDVIVHSAQWRIDIQGLMKDQKDRRFVENIMERLVNATDNFRRSVEQ